MEVLGIGSIVIGGILLIAGAVLAPFGLGSQLLGQEDSETDVKLMGLGLKLLWAGILIVFVSAL